MNSIKSTIFASFCAFLLLTNASIAQEQTNDDPRFPKSLSNPPIRTNYIPTPNTTYKPDSTSVYGAAPSRPTSQSSNAGGSLNFSSPPRAQGPFSKSGAVAFGRRGDWAGLVDYARAWTNAEPNNGLAWFDLGEGAYKTGNWDAAVEAFRRATTFSPQEPEIWNNLAAAYMERKQPALALQAIKDGVAASGSHCNAFDWYHFGNAFKGLDQYQLAINAYNKALAMRPSFPEATGNKGFCLAKLGNFNSAATALKTAGAQGDKNASRNLGLVRAQEAQDNAAANASGSSNNGNVYQWQRHILDSSAYQNSRASH